MVASVAPVLFVFGSTGCTAVGAGVGRSIDESRFGPVQIESAGEDLVGRRVQLHLATGMSYSGRVTQVMRTDESRALVIDRKANWSLLRSVSSATDTVVVTPFDALYVGSEAGNGEGLGIFAGLAIDGLLLYALWQEL